MKKNISFETLLKFFGPILLGIIVLIICNIFKAKIIIATDVRSFKVIKITGCIYIMLGLIFGLVKTFKYIKSKEKSFKKIKMNAPGDTKSIDYQIYLIEKYLFENVSTEYFKNKLEIISHNLETFKDKYKQIDKKLNEKFSTNSLSYSKFFTQINNLYKYIIELISDLMDKLDIFDEKEYGEKIKHYESQGLYYDDNLQKYRQIQNEYKTYIDNVENATNMLLTNLDKLLLEMFKLNDEQLAEKFKELTDLDNIINNLKLYK